jgi:hypothetical protein
VNLFTRIGENDPAKNVFNILRFSIAHEFAVGIRYTGATGKIAFGPLKIASAIRGRIHIDIFLHIIPQIKSNICYKLFYTHYRGSPQFS